MKLNQTDKDILAEARLKEALKVLRGMRRKTVGEQSSERHRVQRLTQQAIELIRSS